MRHGVAHGPWSSRGEPIAIGEIAPGGTPPAARPISRAAARCVLVFAVITIASSIARSIGEQCRGVAVTARTLQLFVDQGRLTAAERSFVVGSAARPGLAPTCLRHMLQVHGNPDSAFSGTALRSSWLMIVARNPPKRLTARDFLQSLEGHQSASIRTTPLNNKEHKSITSKSEVHRC